MATTVKNSWRKFYKVHPSADKFPLLPQDELEALANDIEKNGLKVPIQTRRVGSDTLKRGGWSKVFVIDGRNRLDAMEKVLGWAVVQETAGKHHWAPNPAMRVKCDADNWQSREVEHKDVATHKEIALEVIGFNVRRRHLTKAQQVDLIDEALRASRHGGEMPPNHVGLRAFPDQQRTNTKRRSSNRQSSMASAKRPWSAYYLARRMRSAMVRSQNRNDASGLNPIKQGNGRVTNSTPW
jgi:hypothetical protein